MWLKVKKIIRKVSFEPFTDGEPLHELLDGMASRSVHVNLMPFTHEVLPRKLVGQGMRQRRSGLIFNAVGADAEISLLNERSRSLPVLPTF